MGTQGHKRLVRVIRYFLPLGFIITLFAGMLYGVSQQIVRHLANSPQIQLAEDISAEMSQNQNTASSLPSKQTDIANSLATFVIIFDDQGRVVSSSAMLHGQVPSFPQSVFPSVMQSGEDRITWQPEPGVRVAAVITRFAGAKQGFVLVGRSLRETEDLEDHLFKITIFGWGVGMIVTLFVSLIVVP